MVICRSDISLRIVSNFKIGFFEIHHLNIFIAIGVIAECIWIECHLVLSFKFPLIF